MRRFPLFLILLPLFLLSLRPTETEGLANHSRFQPPELLVPMWDAKAFTVADINGDKVKEILVVAGGEVPPLRYLIFEPLREGGWYVDKESATTLKGTEPEIATGDIDGDGLPEVVRASHSTIEVDWSSPRSTLVRDVAFDDAQGLTVFPGGLSYTNWTPREHISVHLWPTKDTYRYDQLRGYQASYSRVKTGDVNNDGLLDLVVMWGEQLNLSAFTVYYGKNEGGFETEGVDNNGVNLTSLRISPIGMAVGDLNEDHLDDVAVAFRGSYEFLRVFGQREGMVGEWASNYTGTPHDIVDLHIAEVTCQAPPEVVMTSVETPTFSWWTPGTKKYQVEWLGEPTHSWTPVSTLVDITGDGLMDFLALTDEGIVMAEQKPCVSGTDNQFFLPLLGNG